MPYKNTTVGSVNAIGNTTIPELTAAVEAVIDSPIEDGKLVRLKNDAFPATPEGKAARMAYLALRDLIRYAEAQAKCARATERTKKLAERVEEQRAKLAKMEARLDAANGKDDDEEEEDEAAC